MKEEYADPNNNRIVEYSYAVADAMLKAREKIND